MNNKGFTVVEVLAVFTLLAIIALLIVPSVTNFINESKEVTYQTQVNKIIKATYDYSLKNPSILPDYDETSYVTLCELKIKGLIEYNISNPETTKLFEDNLVIEIKNVGANYEYDSINSKLEGDYLYTVLDIYEENLPTITLTGLTADKKGNYLVNLSLNDTFEDYNYNAFSEANININDRVDKIIYKNNKMVSDIDTTSKGLYKINYVVVDSNGYSNLVTLNVIVGDNDAPTLEIPSNATISTSTTSYDLLDGTSCEDDSGDCTVTYTGEIDFGTAGKYVIKYKATDPSGNTSESKGRVITIK